MLTKKCRICYKEFDANRISEVYCKDCKFHYIDLIGYEFCFSPENLEDSYKAPKSWTKLKPSTLNQDNNCKHYQRKWWKFWV